MIQSLPLPTDNEIMIGKKTLRLRSPLDVAQQYYGRFFPGLRSYGKVAYFFGIFPVLGFLIFSIKIIGLLPVKTFKFWFMNTQWLEFVYNGQVIDHQLAL